MDEHRAENKTTDRTPDLANLCAFSARRGGYGKKQRYLDNRPQQREPAKEQPDDTGRGDQSGDASTLPFQIAILKFLVLFIAIPRACPPRSLLDHFLGQPFPAFLAFLIFNGDIRINLLARFAMRTCMPCCHVSPSTGNRWRNVKGLVRMKS
jgi:hypothetical protein